MLSKSPWHKVERQLARFLVRKPISLSNSAGVVSFSFDDVPQSACRNGRQVLENHDCRGTYYVCGGSTDQTSDNGRMHSRSDLRSLVEGGHELACHGFGHRDYQTLTEEEMRADILRNRSFLADCGVDPTNRNFAYPFGCVSPAVKRVVSTMFVSARGIGHGPSKGLADLALLDAVPLYQALWSESSLADLIGKSAAQGVWLVFFSHEVVDDPGTFGCTPSLLDFAVRTAKASGCRVLPVEDALKYVAGPT